MLITPSLYLQELGGYPFAEIDKIAADLKTKGIKPIDFGVGDPTSPAPQFIRDIAKNALDQYAAAGYPSYIGQWEYRLVIAQWMHRRFNIVLNPATEICSTLGSKEAIFNFPKAIVNPGDIVIIPTPGYPPMKTGTLFSGAVPYFAPLTEENNFLLDYNSIPDHIAKKARIIWLNYPNSPTGSCANRDYYNGLINWADKNNIIIAADEGCYIDIYFDHKPMSILEIKREGIISFYSMSKRSNMTGYRVGWVAGDERLITLFKKIKTNIDSGTPNFIQTAAIAALNDETHANQMREEYRQKKELILDALSSLGLPRSKSAATFYLWQKTPKNLDSVEFAKLLLEPSTAIVVTPGQWITENCANGANPGNNYVRFALVPELTEVTEAAGRIKKLKLPNTKN